MSLSIGSERKTHFTNRRRELSDPDVCSRTDSNPQETENVLILHPKVADVAVIGVPNEDFGEEAKAAVRLEDMSQASPELAPELSDFCCERISSVKCPRSVDFEAGLPRHPTGKLSKRLLKDRYWGNKDSRIV